MGRSANPAARVAAIASGLALIAVAVYPLGPIAFAFFAGHQGSYSSWSWWVFRCAALGVPLSLAALGITLLIWRSRRDWRRCALALLVLTVDLAVLVAAAEYSKYADRHRYDTDGPCHGVPPSACTPAEPQQVP